MLSICFVCLGQGQRVLSYVVEAHLQAIGWQTVTTGRSIGHKRIFVLDAAVAVSGIRLTVTKALGYPVIKYFAGYDCSVITV